MKTFGWFVRVVVAGLFTAASNSKSAESGASGGGGSSFGFTNLNFETGAPGGAPPGWNVPRVLADQGFSAVLTTDQPSEGRQCIEVRWPKEGTPSGSFANVMQRVDATPLRGKRVKVTAAIRVAVNQPNGRAQMWLRVDRPGGMGAFDNMNDRPVVSSAWQDYSITADIAEDARTINLGLMTQAGATAWWDNVRCEVLSVFMTLTEPPRPLTDAGLSNVVAFTRLVGYVRHFHPSDQAASNDWLKRIVATLPQVESAASPSELATRLESAFKSVAPTARVFEAGKEPPLPAELTLKTNLASLRVRAWEHIGYGQSAVGVQHVYRSARLNLDARELATLPPYAQPTNVFRANLSAGVACFVPTAVFANERETLPHIESTPQGASAEARFSVEHRGARLATVMLAWNILQHFYPYFDVIDTDWSKELEVALRTTATDTNEAAFYRTLNRLVANLQDGHGTLSGPGQPIEAPLPIKVELIEEKLVIVAVATNVTDLKPGDVIERVDGVPAREAYDQLASQVSAATPQRRKQVAFRLGWGPFGSQARLEVRGADETLRSVTLPRAEKLSPLEMKRPPKVEELKPGVCYVDITRLSDTEFNEALPRLAKATGLVFDMRGYPPGSPTWLTHLSAKPLQSAHWNIPKRHRPDNTDLQWETSRWDLQPSQAQLTTNRVFLSDGSAISYAESVMGIVEAYRLGEIIGEPTAGTNGNIAPTDLPLGYRMVWTGMRVLKHDGTRHHGVGILPTVPVTKTIKGIREGRDEQLERALALIK